MAEALNEKTVTIIVPTLNERENVLPLIRSICMQSYRPIEVVFVDGGSHDGTRGLLLRAIREFSTPMFKLVLILEEDFAGRKGPAHARNIGIKSASGEHLILLDADTSFLTPKSVSVMKRLLDRYDFVKVKTAIQVDTTLERSLAQNGSLYYHCGYRKRVFASVLFKEELGFGEDRDLWFRIKRDLGVEVKTSDEVLLSRHLPHTVNEYLGQAKWYGKTFRDFVQNIIDEKEFVYLDEVAQMLVGCPLAFFPPVFLLFSFMKDVKGGNRSIDFLIINFLRRYVFLYYLGTSSLNRKSFKNYAYCIAQTLSRRIRK